MLERLAERLKAPLRIALVRAAARHRARLTSVRFVGITGSCGKTTTKELLADCLARRAPCTRSRASNNSIWSVAKTILRTHPRHAFAVLEMGTDQRGDLVPLAALARPQVAIVTCIAPSHVEGLGSLDDIATEKAELLRTLPAGGLAVLSRDEPRFERLRGAVPPRARLVTVSLDAGADYVTAAQKGGVEIWERGTDTRVRLTLSIPGRAQMTNATLAAAVARQLGVEWPDIVQALELSPGLPMRWQRREHGGVSIVNDAYNANPASMRMALETFADMRVAGRKWLVLGGMRELGGHARAEHAALGQWIARSEWAGLITVGELGGWIAASAREAGFPADHTVACMDPDDAARALARRTLPGDAVLFKASRAIRLERTEALWIRLHRDDH